VTGARQLAVHAVPRADAFDWAIVLETLDTIRGLSIRQPWLWAIMHGKPVENRRKLTLPKSRLAWLHASRYDAWDPAGEFSDLVQATWQQVHGTALVRGQAIMPFGAIVGLMESGGYHHAADCVGTDSANGRRVTRLCTPWAARGQFHNEVARVYPLPEPVPCGGMLGLWPLPPAALEVVRYQLQALAGHVPCAPVPGQQVPSGLTLIRNADRS
jgi:hypothetical protein